MTRRILLTGATGFVGRQIVRALVERGVAIRAVVRQAGGPVAFTGVDEVVRTSDLFAESGDWLARACDGVDTVIHAAWYAEHGRYLQSPVNLQCLQGTLALARAATSAGVRRFVGIGSCTEYKEDSADLSPEAPLGPTSLYAACKAAAYLALSQWFALHGREAAWCRLFYLYGEGEDERRLIPYLRRELDAGRPVELTRGEQVRDFMDVRDAGALIADIALGDHVGPANVCSGVGVTVRELAERMADERGRRHLLRFGARQENLFDPPRVVGIPTRP